MEYESKYLVTKMVDNEWQIVGLYNSEEDALGDSDSDSFLDTVKIYQFCDDIAASYFIAGVEAVNDSSLQAELLNQGMVIILDNIFQVNNEHIGQLKKAV